MEKVERFSISISPKLLKKFDAILKERGYANRSEGIRDLIRDYIVA
ncbi:MAG: ribbon-helix-helix protein, CopG family, partial [Methanobacteriota archaeon]